MKLLLWCAAVVLLAFSAMHVFITFEHWRAIGPKQESVLAPAVLALLTAGVGLRAIRQARRRPPAA